MIRPINRDMLRLRIPSVEATREDQQVATDLLETLAAHKEECVGMAANMIGVNKRIIAVSVGFMNIIMYNPVITKKSGRYETEEGCLSLFGKRKCIRYEQIEVTYQDQNFVQRTGTFSGFSAEIIQHECDHLEGIII